MSLVVVAAATCCVMQAHIRVKVNVHGAMSADVNLLSADIWCEFLIAATRYNL